MGVVAATVIGCIGCWQLRLLPRQGQWGRATWAKFHELFVFGRDVFLYTMGSQIVNLSQTLLLTRLVSLNAALTWSIYTRAYVVLSR